MKVLDFGLAKAIESVGTEGLPVSNSPTMTSPAYLARGAMTSDAGIVLGTAAYMAPEQAKGRSVDKRADIWAFGVVLVEMLTGRMLFAGESMAETIAAVIKEDPKLDRLPAETPAAVRQLVARCLERDPKERLRDIGEARILLSKPIPPEAPISPALPRRRWIPAILGAVAVAAVAGLLAWSVKPAPSAPVRRFELPAALADAADVAIAPDGSRLAYLLGGHLFVRRLDELDAKDLGRMHATAGQLAWSPDGGTIGFTAEASIQSISADGGPHFVIGKIPASGSAMGLAWLRSGKIVFPVWRDSLYEVASTGGTPAVRLAIDEASEIDFHHVAALPDDRLLLSTHKRKEDSDVIELVDGQRRTVLTTDRGVSWFEYVAPGTLLFRRTSTNVGIWAMPFNGGPIDVNAATLVQPGAMSYRVGVEGTIVAQIPAQRKASLVWIALGGAETSVPGPIVEIPGNDLELSPDGRRAAFVQGRRVEAGAGVGSTGPASIVTRDLQLGVDTRLTGPAADAGMWADIGVPTWFPAGDRLLHRIGGVENLKLVERRADAAGEAAVLTSGDVGRVLPDGRTLIFLRDERGRRRLRSATIGATGVVEDKALFATESQPIVRDFDVSRSGRLVAYVVVQPDRRGDIYLVDLSDVRAQRLVHEGGNRPRFAGDSQLFFATGTPEEDKPGGRLMRVSLNAGSSISIGAATEVFRETPDGPRLMTYDVTPDGDRLLMWKPVQSPGAQPRFVLIQNALKHAF